MKIYNGTKKSAIKTCANCGAFFEIRTRLKTCSCGILQTDKDKKETKQK